jgi:hypothetical protein
VIGWALRQPEAQAYVLAEAGRQAIAALERRLLTP